MKMKGIENSAERWVDVEQSIKSCLDLVGPQSIDVISMLYDTLGMCISEGSTVNGTVAQLVERQPLSSSNTHSVLTGAICVKIACLSCD